MADDTDTSNAASVVSQRAVDAQIFDDITVLQRQEQTGGDTPVEHGTVRLSETSTPDLTNVHDGGQTLQLRQAEDTLGQAQASQDDIAAFDLLSEGAQLPAPPSAVPPAGYSAAALPRETVRSTDGSAVSDGNVPSVVGGGTPDAVTGMSAGSGNGVGDAGADASPITAGAAAAESAPEVPPTPVAEAIAESLSPFTPAEAVPIATAAPTVTNDQRSYDSSKIGAASESPSASTPA